MYFESYYFCDRLLHVSIVSTLKISISRTTPAQQKKCIPIEPLAIKI